MGEPTQRTICIFFILIMAFIAFVAFINADREMALASEKTNFSYLIKTDSCGWKVCRVESDGKVFIVNSQGGVCQVEKDNK